MAVLEPLKVVISNFPNDSGSIDISVPNFPADESRGSRTVKLTSTIYIEKTDFSEVGEKDTCFEMSASLAHTYNVNNFTHCRLQIRTTNDLQRTRVLDCGMLVLSLHLNEQ